MAQIQQPYIFGDATNGILDDKSVADNLMPKNAVRFAVNCIFDYPRGAVSQREGTTVLGSAFASQVLGLHNLRSSTTGYNQLIAVYGNSVYYYDTATSTWASTTSVSTSGLKARFLTYLDNAVILNGTDSPKCWTGTGGWSSSGGDLDIGNFPVGKYADILNTRIYTVGVSSAPDTVYCSSLESGGAISWSSGTKNFRVYPNDGKGNITGLKSNGKIMLIFKERGIYRYDDYQLDFLAPVGTPSYESIVSDDNGITYFFGQSAGGVGFYMTSGALPQKISRMITMIVEAISPSYYTNVAGFTDGQSVYWSIGSVTLDGITYSNAWVVWNIADKSWEFRNYADRYTVFSPYITTTGALTIVGGDTDGNVQTIDSGNTDNSTPIEAMCDWGSTIFTTRGRTKVVNEVVTLAKNYQGLSFLLKVDDGEYEKIGSIDRAEKVHSLKMRGNKFYFRISSVNSGTPFQFDGFECWDVTDEGITR